MSSAELPILKMKSRLKRTYVKSTFSITSTSLVLLQLSNSRTIGGSHAPKSSSQGKAKEECHTFECWIPGESTVQALLYSKVCNLQQRNGHQPSITR